VQAPSNDQEKIKEVKGDDEETTSIHQPRRASNEKVAHPKHERKKSRPIQPDV